VVFHLHPFEKYEKTSKWVNFIKKSFKFPHFAGVKIRKKNELATTVCDLFSRALRKPLLWEKKNGPSTQELGSG